MGCSHDDRGFGADCNRPVCFLAVDLPWKEIVDLIWKGNTIQQACEKLWLDYQEVDRAMCVEIRRLILDTSLVASARDEMLNKRDL